MIYIRFLLAVLPALSNGQICCFRTQGSQCSIRADNSLCDAARCESICGGKWGGYIETQGCDGSNTGKLKFLTIIKIPSFLLPPYPMAGPGRRLLWSDWKWGEIGKSLGFPIGTIVAMVLPDDPAPTGLPELADATAEAALAVAQNSQNIVELTAALDTMTELSQEADRKFVTAIGVSNARIDTLTIAVGNSIAEIKDAITSLQIGVIVGRQETIFLIMLNNNKELSRIMSVSPLVRKLGKIASTSRYNPSFLLPLVQDSFIYYSTTWNFGWSSLYGEIKSYGLFSKITVTRTRSLLSYLMESDESIWTYTVEPLGYGRNTATELNPCGTTDKAACLQSEYSMCHTKLNCWVEPVTAAFGQPRRSKVFSALNQAVYQETPPCDPYDEACPVPEICGSMPNPQVCASDDNVTVLADLTQCQGLREGGDCDFSTSVVGAHRTTIWLENPSNPNPFLRPVTEFDESAGSGYTNLYLGTRIVPGVTLPLLYAYATYFNDPFDIAMSEMIPDFPTLPEPIKEMLAYGGDNDNIVYGVYGPMIDVEVSRQEGTGKLWITNPISLAAHSDTILDGYRGLKPFTGHLATTGCSIDNVTGMCCNAEEFGPVVKSIPYIKGELEAITEIQYRPEVIVYNFIKLNESLADLRILIDEAKNRNTTELEDEIGDIQDRQDEGKEETARIRKEANDTSTAMVALAAYIRGIDFTPASSSSPIMWIALVLSIFSFICVCVLLCVIGGPRVSSAMKL
jgi:hypothetical protein